MGKTFITYNEGLEIIKDHRVSFPIFSVPLQECGGRILAENIVADRDFPPYDRVTMDGIAISYSAFENGVRTFQIQEISAAGTKRKSLSGVDFCIEVMTGSVLPENTDTVIRYEDLEIKDKGARITINSIARMQNVHCKGVDITAGTVIKKAGERISSAEINVAAATGMDSVLVYQMPKVIIISTGDELVDVHEKPLAHQIRRSNIYGIRNTLNEWGVSSDLQHLPDDKSVMESMIVGFLVDYDLLIFTGGVSKGKYDYLPEALSSVGVMKHFHKVQQRPGKPFWFGTMKNSSHVFALPGNPVSSFVCLYVYIKYWFRKSLRIKEEPVYVKLLEDITFKPDLTLFIQAKITSAQDGTLGAKAVTGNGSGDFTSLVSADGFLVLPQEKDTFKAGEVYPFIYYRTKL